MKNVALFTLPNCKWCKDLELYLKNRKIRYNKIDVTTNKKALMNCKKRCSKAPVVLIGDIWICGFDKEKINKELGIK